MAQRFNLTAQLQLQAPANTRQVVGQIRKQLKDIGVDVKIKTNTRQVAQLNKELQGVSKAGTASAKSIQNLNATLAQSARRFSVITIATGSLLAFTRALKNSIGDAVAFERELLKISQVTGKSVNQLQTLTSEVTRLSTTLGAGSAELLNVSRTLAQAGFNADKTKRALQSLAQTTLAATFDNIQDTTEGAIAILRQFGAEASRAGGDIKFLESTLDSINSVSKNFAVEAGDLITVIRRVGGVFSATGGSVNELIALFTSVRATTRESAETIATGLRTIFTRIQRTDTVDQLKQLGVELRNAQGQFVGAFEAVRRLSVGLASLDPKDTRFSDIVEELGGFRQVGKVIPLIQQFTTAQNALAVAQNSAGSVARDAAVAQLGLGNQISKVKEEFSALIRQFADSGTFRSITTGALELAKAFLRIASALETALPLITTLVGLKLGRSLGAGLGGLLGGGGAQRRNQGGKIHAFARGGFVPGSGNRDTVPAMLQPGEFVIKKSSAKKLGASTLEAMNNNRYGQGSVVRSVSKYTQSRAMTFDDDVELSKKKNEVFAGKKRFSPTDTIGYNRVPNIAVDVNDFPKRRSQGFKAYRQAVRDNNAKARGIAFEKVVKELNAGITLAKGAGEDRDAPTSRIDAIFNQIPYEVKSRSNQISDDELGRKVVGAAISPRSTNIDKQVQKKLTERTLRSSKDNIILGSAGLIYDETDLTRIKRDKDVGQKAKRLGRGSQPSEKLQTAAFGGRIQKFALGGIAKVNKIGAAILDPDKKVAAESVSIGIGDVRKFVTGSGTAGDRAKKGVSEVFKGKKYNVFRQGLNKKTSDGFKASITNGLADGLDSATSNLGVDLGLGTAKLDSGGRQRFIDFIAKRGNVMGDIFESAVNSLSNRGAFSSEQIGAPFDFPRGLSGSLRDNYSGLPSSYVDAKSSYSAASTANLKGKIAQELADEYKRSGDYDKFAKPKTKKAAGGTSGSSDTVPALLTPGEFVINKSSAQSIGYANLSKMNQTGVQRFAAGGTVGAVQRFANGGGVSSGGLPNIALLKALQSLTTAVDKLEKSTLQIIRGFSLLEKQTLDTTQDTKKLGDAEEKAAKQTQGKGGGVAGVAQRVDVVAGAAQSFVFLGSAASALVAEFSSLEDKTKNAIQATVAQFSSLVGIVGTVTQVFTSLILAKQQAIVAEQAGTAAKVAGTVAEGADTVATTASAAAEGAEATVNATSASSEAVKTAANAAATESEGVKTAANYGSAQSELQKQKANASQGLSPGGVGALGGAFAALTASVIGVLYFINRQKEETKAFVEAAKNAVNALKETGTGSTAAIVQAQQQAIVAEESELSIGQGVTSVGAGVVGGAVGGLAAGALAGALAGSAAGPVGTVVGGLVGLGAALYTASYLAEENAEAAKQAAEEQRAALETSVDALVSTAKKQKEFEKGLEALNTRIFADTKEGKTQRIRERSNLVQIGIESADTGPAAQKMLDDIAAGLKKPLSQIKPDDILDPNLRAEFSNYKDTVAVASESLKAAASTAAQNLQEAIALEVTGEFSIEELLGQGGAFAKAYQDNIAIIERQNAAEEARLQAILAETEIILKLAQASGDTSAIEAANKARRTATKELSEQRERSRESVQKFKKSIDEVGEAAGTNRDKQIRAAEAAEELRQRLKALSDATVALNTFGVAIDEAATRLDNQIAVATGGKIKFQAGGLRGIDQGTGQITDSEKFERSISSAIKSLPKELRADARLQADTLRNQDRVFGDLKERFVGDKISSTAPAGEARALATEIFEAANTGIGLDQQAAQDAIDKIQASLQTAEGLSAEVFDEVFSSVRKEGEAGKAYFDKLNKIRQTEIDSYDRYLDAVGKVRADAIKAEQKVIDVGTKGNELLAKARGTTVSSAAREQARTARAQAGLAGTGIQAGNLGSVRSALDRARAGRQDVADRLAQGDLTYKQTRQLQREQAKYIRIIEKATEELGRLSNQADRAADIMAEIDKEKEKRETLTGIIGEFVVGGRDERAGLANAAAGIKSAVKTLTIQNQSPEQRKATFALLDRLGDIEIAGTRGLSGTGELLTAKEFKKGLIFQDAIRLGLDPRIAEQLANSTSKEQELINALEQLTVQMRLAAGIEAVKARKRAEGLAQGGPVYKSDGGTIFQPRGTDTVPAMLTPGEFVIRKSAVDKIGVGTLQALNSGSTQHLSRGGVVQYLKNGKKVEEDYRKGVIPDWMIEAQDNFKSYFQPIEKTETSKFEKDVASVPGKLGKLADVPGRLAEVLGLSSPTTTITTDSSEILVTKEQFEAEKARRGSMRTYSQPELEETSITGELLNEFGRMAVDVYRHFSGQGGVTDEEALSGKSLEDIYKNRRLGIDPNRSSVELSPAIHAGRRAPEGLGTTKQFKSGEELEHFAKAGSLRGQRELHNKALDEIRNQPDELVFDSKTNKVFRTEHGQKMHDQRAAANARDKADYLEGKGKYATFHKDPAEERRRMSLWDKDEDGDIDERDYRIHIGLIRNVPSKAARMTVKKAKDEEAKAKAEAEAQRKAESQAELQTKLDKIQADAATEQGLSPDLVRQQSKDFRKKLYDKPTKEDLLYDPNISDKDWATLTPDQKRQWLRNDKNLTRKDRLKLQEEDEERQSLRDRRSKPPTLDGQLVPGETLEERLDAAGKIALNRSRKKSTREKQTTQDLYEEMGLPDPKQFRINQGNPESRQEKLLQYRAAKNYLAYKKKMANRNQSVPPFNHRDDGMVNEWGNMTKAEALRRAVDTRDMSQSRKKRFEARTGGRKGRRSKSDTDAEKRRDKKLFGRQAKNIADLAFADTATGEDKDGNLLIRSNPQRREAHKNIGGLFDPSKASTFSKNHDRFVSIKHAGEFPKALLTLQSILAGTEGNISQSKEKLQKVLGVFQGMRVSAMGAFHDADREVKRLSDVGATGDPEAFQLAMKEATAMRRHYLKEVRAFSSQARDIAGPVSALYSNRLSGIPRARAVFGVAARLLNRNNGISALRKATEGVGPAFYFNQGGGINAADTVPAMLTPGEFVMSKSAVDRHGVGFMKNLNRGQVQGFNSGGYVSNQGVAYLNQGSNNPVASGGLKDLVGSLFSGEKVSLDPSGLANILGNFEGGFGSTIENAVKSFSSVGDMLTSLMKSFGQIAMNHTFQGDMTLAFSITNGDAIKNSIAEAISPKIKEIIAQELETRLNKDFRIGQ